MSKVIQEVTPLTRGIIWLTGDEADSSNPHYKEIDYLLDGLLTANILSVQNLSSRVIIGKNFNSDFFVFITKEIKESELESYVSLLKDLTTENDIVVLDELGEFNQLRSLIGKVNTHLRLI